MSPDGQTDVQAPAEGARACHLVDHEGAKATAFDRPTVERLLEGKKFFWLDLYQPHADDYAILRDVFKFHPLAVEDSEHFDQRAKLDEYDDYVFMVVYGASKDEDRLVEVHCFYSEKFLITVHRDDAPALAALRERYQKRNEPITDPPLLLYKIAIASLDSERAIPASGAEEPRDPQPGWLRATQLVALTAWGVAVTLVAAPIGRPGLALVLGVLTAPVAELPGMSVKEERYFRDVYDHLIRISDLIDTYRDLLTGAMDVYLSTVSNRLNVVMKQLAIIATIFLPLAWLTGFFGQNFGFLVKEIGSWQTFVLLGLGSEVVAVIALFVMFKKRGWF